MNNLNTKFRLALILIASSFIFACGQKDEALNGIDQFISESKIDTSKPGWKQSLPKPPQQVFTPGKQYLWHIQTNKGKMVVEIKGIESPMHVTSTIYLTTLGFYDDIVFHRIIPGFMAQGGDPLGVGVGGPGYYYMGEFD